MANVVNTEIGLKLLNASSENLLKTLENLRQPVTLTIGSNNLQGLEKQLVTINKLANIDVTINIGGALAQLNRLAQQIQTIRSSLASLNTPTGGSILGPNGKPIITPSSGIGPGAGAAPYSPVNYGPGLRVSRLAQSEPVQEALYYGRVNRTNTNASRIFNRQEVEDIRISSLQRARIQEQEAQRYLQGSRGLELFLAQKAGIGNEEKILEETGVKFGINPNRLQGVQGSLFNSSRLLNKDSLQQLAFAGLFGGTPSLAGGALGGLAGGPGGVLLGSVIGQVGGRAFSDVIDKIRESLEKASEAGQIFERSILGIASILQENTRYKGLPIEQQLQLQQNEARKIQIAARGKLLPLGIAGTQEATLVQGLTSALASRGIIADEKQIATIASRIGAAIVTQRPQLLENTGLLLRDVQDVFGGGPLANRAVLSQLIRPALGGIQRGTSAESIEKATQPLQALYEAATKADNVTVLFKKLGGAIDNLFTNVGDAYVNALKPGLSELAKSLSDPKIFTGLVKVGEAFGNMTSTGLQAAASVINLTTSFIKFVDPIKSLVLTFASFDSGPLGALAQLINFVRSFSSEPKKQPITNAPTPKAEITPQGQLNATLNRLGLKKEFDEASQNLLESPEVQLRGLIAATNKFRKAGLSADELNYNEIGSSTIASGLREKILQNRLGSINQETPGGLNTAAALTISTKQEELQDQQVILKNLKLRLAQEKGNTDIEGEIESVNVKILTLRKEIHDQLKNQIEALQLEARLQKDIISTTTFAGRRAQLNIDIQEAQKEAQKYRIAASQDTNVEDVRVDNLKAQAASTRAYDLEQQRLPLLVAEINNLNAVKESLFNFREGIFDIVEKFKELGRSIFDTTNQLNDFKENARLRELGDIGEQISAAEREFAAGGAGYNIPGSIQELAKGSPLFNEDTRADFERELAERNYDDVDRRFDFFRRQEESNNYQDSLQDRSAQQQRERDVRLPNQAQQLALQTSTGILQAYSTAGAGSPIGQTLQPLVDNILNSFQQNYGDYLDKNPITGATGSNTSPLGETSSPAKAVEDKAQQTQQQNSQHQRETTEQLKALQEQYKQTSAKQMTKADFVDAIRVGDTMALNEVFS